ncbi:MAG: histidine phosphatase family protein, partial [Myxococcota bacterium]
SNARDFTYPGGDNRLDFEERVRRATRSLRSGAPSLLLVLHKGVIKIILAELLGMDFQEYRQLPVDLGSVHVVDVYPDFAKMVTKNETSHLGDCHIKDVPPPR